MDFDAGAKAFGKSLSFYGEAEAEAEAFVSNVDAEANAYLRPESGAANAYLRHVRKSLFALRIKEFVDDYNKTHKDGLVRVVRAGLESLSSNGSVKLDFDAEAKALLDHYYNTLDRLGRVERAGLVAMYRDGRVRAFVEHYYNTLDTCRAGLFALYQDDAMLTLEGSKFQGVQAIVGVLSSQFFQQCKHNISTFDYQPSGPGGGMLVFVSGTLQLLGEQHQPKFSQMFHLMPTPWGGFLVFNDIFRLNCDA